MDLSLLLLPLLLLPYVLRRLRVQKGFLCFAAGLVLIPLVAGLPQDTTFTSLSDLEGVTEAPEHSGFVLNLLFVLLVGWGAGLLTARMGYPAVLGELLAGILLGPPLLGLLHGGVAIDVLAEVGVLLMMLYIGMEVEPGELGKATKAGFLAAAGGFITPFLLCYGAVYYAAQAGYVEVVNPNIAGIFVGVAAGVTSLATKSRILVDLKLLDTRLAHVMMAGALIADTVSLVVFAAVLGVAQSGTVDAFGLGLVAVKALTFFAVSGAIGLYVLPWLGNKLRGLGRSALFTFVLLIGLGFAEMAELAGLHGILGTFIAGLFLRETIFGTTLTNAISDLVRQASLGFLAPIFFVSAGFAVTLNVFTENLGLLLAVVGLATVGKVVGTALFYLPTGHGWREGITLGAGMNGRGAVEIILAQIALTMGLIGPDIFSILVFMAIITTAMVPLFLKWGTDWLERRGELVRSGRREGVLIIGAGPLARRLAKMLQEGSPVALVDRNASNTERAEAEGLRAFAGSALDEEALREAGAGTASYLVALTPNPELNALVAQVGRTIFSIPHVLVPDLSRRDGARAIREHVGATALFGDPFRLSDWDFYADRGEVEVEEVGLDEGPVPVPTPHRLPVAVRQGEAVVPYHRDTALKSGDRLLVLRRSMPATPPSQDRFDALVRACPILDFDGTPPMESFFDEVGRVLGPRLETDPETLAAQFVRRETTANTVVLPGLAIPHVIVEGEGRFEMLIARCREGCLFPGQAQAVRAAFVLASTKDERTFHLRALSAITQIMQAEDFEQRWLEASDAEELRRLVLDAERRRG